MKIQVSLLFYFVFCNTIFAKECPYGFAGSKCDECGLEFKRHDLKIIGGFEATPNSWPSTALIVFNFTFLVDSKVQNVVTFCGGTLIDRQTVLTAAHCNIEIYPYNFEGIPLNIPVMTNQFHPTIESIYTVYLGVHNKSSIMKNSELPSHVVKMPVKKFIKHAWYNDVNSTYDIGLIKLEKEAELNEFIQIACLPNEKWGRYPSKTFVKSWAAGWGVLGNGSLPDNLQDIRLQIYGPWRCKDVAPEMPKIWDQQICAGELKGGKDTCVGDSGGPLFVREKVNKKEKFVLVGITSYGVGCAFEGYPAIYTRVSGYLKWIKENSN